MESAGIHITINAFYSLNSLFEVFTMGAKIHLFSRHLLRVAIHGAEFSPNGGVF